MIEVVSVWLCWSAATTLKVYVPAGMPWIPPLPPQAERLASPVTIAMPNNATQSQRLERSLLLTPKRTTLAIARTPEATMRELLPAGEGGGWLRV